MVARWVGQNSGPVFRRLWSEVHQIKFACVVLSVVCNAVFRLAMSCCVPEITRDQVAKLSEIAPEFLCFWAAKFRGEKQTPKFLTEFYKSGSPSNVWRSW